MEEHRWILHNTEPINPERRLLRAKNKKRRRKKKRSASTGQNHNEACELINASLMKCAAFRVNLMTKGSRSLNGLFIAFDLFQTAAVKTIMFSHRRYRGQTVQVIIPCHTHHHQRPIKKIHPGTGLNDKWSPRARMAAVSWDFMDNRRPLSSPKGGSTEWKCHSRPNSGN